MVETAAPVTQSGSALMAPVSESRRIVGLDVARGFALLGILFVNIQSFGEPFGKFITIVPPEGSTPGDLIAFYFVKIFCEGKFYALFSTLFGVGLAMQWVRAKRAGGRFGAIYARRLFLLGVIGLLHGILIWYGDILFMYSLVGAAATLFVGLAPRALAIIGSGLVVFATSLTLCAGAAGMLVPDQGETPAPAAIVSEGADEVPFEAEASAAEEAASAVDEASAAEAEVDAEANENSVVDAPATRRSPLRRLFQGFQTGQVQSPMDPYWIDIEREIFRDGGFGAATALRAMLFGGSLVFALFGWGFQIVGVFLIGIALLKGGALGPEGGAWQRRLVMMGALVGLPLVVFGAVAPYTPMGYEAAMAIALPLQMIGGTLMALGYLGGIMLLVSSGRCRALVATLAPVGRMALSNYLLQSVLATFVMYHWGLGLFGETTRAERMLLVGAIYLAVVVVSNAWLRVFRFGPMEWVWRSATYLRLQPMLRTGAGTGAGRE